MAKSKEEIEYEELLKKAKAARVKANSLAVREPKLYELLNSPHIKLSRIAFELYKQEGEDYETAYKSKRVNTYSSRFITYMRGGKKMNPDDMTRLKKIVKNEVAKMLDLVKQI